MFTLNLLTKETRKMIKNIGGKSIFENYLGSIMFTVNKNDYTVAKTKKGFSLWNAGKVIKRDKTIKDLLDFIHNLEAKNQQQKMIKEKNKQSKIAKEIAKEINVKLIPTGYSIESSKSTIATEFMLYDDCGNGILFRAKGLNESFVRKEIRHTIRQYFGRY